MAESITGGTYFDALGVTLVFWKEINKLNPNLSMNSLVDGIVTDCKNKNKIKVKLRNGSEVNAKGMSFTVQNNAWVLLMAQYKRTGLKLGVPTFEVSDYTVIGIRYATEDGGYGRTPTTYSV